MSKIIYNEGQQKIIDLDSKGHNLFIIGPAGVGKTVVTNALKTKKTFVATPTGTSSRLVGGVTNHTGFGAKVGVLTPDLIRKPAKAAILNTLRSIDKLTLDEFGFVRYDMVAYIDQQMRYAKEVNLPFGGVQVVCSGDPYQLLAMLSSSKSKGTQSEKDVYNQFYNGLMYSFQYEALDLKVCELTQPMRAEDEREFRIMNSIRKCDRNLPLAIQRVHELTRPFDPDEDVTHICAYNKDAEEMNMLRYNRLNTREVVYNYEYKGDSKLLAREVPIPLSFKVKEGMRVMFVANNTETWEWTNGSTGIISQIEADLLVVTQDDGHVSAVRMQEFEVKQYATNPKGGLYQKKVGYVKGFPLCMAFARSTHKAQGATLGNVALNLGNRPVGWCHGLAYVGLTRTRRFSDVRLVRKLTLRDFTIDPIVSKYFS